MTDDWVRLRAGALELALAPRVGGSIARFRHGVQELMRPAPDGATDAGMMGCFPLVPFANRIRDGRFRCDGREICLKANLPPDPSPMHGQGWRGAWDVARADEHSAMLTFTHQPGEWPWRYAAAQTFTLDENGLTVDLSCRNLSTERMPCALGLHPYFPCDGRTMLDTQVGDVWTIDDKTLPVARVPASGNYDPSNGPVCGRGLDNGYEDWGGEATIDWTQGKRLRFAADAPRFQLYAPKEGALFVAEPVENANAALNLPQDSWGANGIALLEEGEERALSVRLDILH